MARYAVQICQHAEGWTLRLDGAQHGPFPTYADALELALQGARALRACGNDVDLRVPGFPGAPLDAERPLARLTA